MSLQERVCLLLVFIMILVNFNVGIGQSLGTDKALYDFKITWTLNASLDLNSENPIGWAILNITITNTGMMPDEYTIDTRDLCGWPAVISPQTIPFSEAIVFPGETINFHDTLIVPSDTPPGHVCHLKMVTQSVSSPQQITKEEEVSLTLHSSYLSLQKISVLPIAPRDGQDVTIFANLANNGNFYEPNSTVSFFIDNESLASNISAGRMEPGETQNISVVWRAISGNHRIEARTENWFSDDENRSKEIEMIIKPATTTETPALRLFDVLPAILLLVLLVVVLVKRTKAYKKR